MPEFGGVRFVIHAINCLIPGATRPRPSRYRAKSQSRRSSLYEAYCTPSRTDSNIRANYLQRHLFVNYLAIDPRCRIRQVHFLTYGATPAKRQEINPPTLTLQEGTFTSLRFRRSPDGRQSINGHHELCCSKCQFPQLDKCKRQSNRLQTQ